MNQLRHGDSMCEEHDHISISSSESNDAVSDIVEVFSEEVACEPPLSPNTLIDIECSTHASEPTEPHHRPFVDSVETIACDVPTYDGVPDVGYEYSPSPCEHPVALIHDIPAASSTNIVSEDDFSDFGFMRHDVTIPAFARTDLPVRPFAFGYVCSGDRGVGRVQGDGDAAAGPPPLPSLPTTPVSIVSAPVDPQWFGLRDTDHDHISDSHMEECHADEDDGYDSEYEKSLMSHSDSAVVPHRSMDSVDTHVSSLRSINPPYGGTSTCTRCVCLARCGACGRDLRVLR